VSSIRTHTSPISRLSARCLASSPGASFCQIAAEESRLVVEPSGALTIAAVRFHRAALGPPDSTGMIVAVVSGGNVDPVEYRRYLEAPIPD